MKTGKPGFFSNFLLKKALYSEPAGKGGLRVIAVFFGSLLLLFGLFPQSGTATQPSIQEPSTVLVIHSYHQGFSWTDSVQQGVNQFLEQASRPVDVVVEYMDAKRYPGKSLYPALAELLQIKYVQEQPDLIISCDDDALHFLFTYRKGLFPRVPVVFCGLNIDDYDPSILDKKTGYTGVVERLDLSSTIDLILRMQPEVERIAFVHDRTTSGLADRQTIESLAINYKDKVRFTFPDDDFPAGMGLSEAELLSSLKQLGQDSAVYFLGFFRDRFNEPLPAEHIIGAISEASPGPVYSHAEAFLGYGILGGKLLSGEKHGKATAAKALRLLEGADVEQEPVSVQSSNRYMFDYEQLERFPTLEKRIPAGSLIINQPTSFLERYKTALLWSLAAISALVVFTVVLGASVLRHRRAEAALKASEEKFRSFFDYAGEGIVITNDKATIIHANPMAALLLGYESVEDLRERNGREFIYPADLESNDPALLKEHHGAFHTSARLLKRDNSCIPAEITIKSINSTNLYTAIFKDDSERKSFEKALSRSEERYRLLASNAADVIWTTDSRFALTYVSPSVERVFGFKVEEYKILPLEKLYPPESCHLIRQRIEARLEKWRKGINGLAPGRLEVEHFTKQGERIWVEIVKKPIVDEQGKVRGMVGVTRDISQRKKLESQREEMERMMRHDLKTPLSGVIGIPQILIEDENLTSEQREYLNMIMDSGRRMLDLINLTLAMTKIEQGNYEIIPRPFNLLRTLEQVLSDLSAVVPGKKIIVDSHLTGSWEKETKEIHIKGDELLTYFMLGNLIKNAIEASPREEHVKIVIRQEEAIIIEIKNFGAVSAGIRDRFFEKHVTTGKKGGTGLGTYSARLMAEAMGYRIRMETSDYENKTTIFVKIPFEDG